MCRMLFVDFIGLAIIRHCQNELLAKLSLMFIAGVPISSAWKLLQDPVIQTAI